MAASGNVFYFAYGSNMDPRRFRERVGPWVSRLRATLHDHALRFAENVRSEGGGGAVVDADLDARVDGVLFEITAAQMAAMDREEFDAARDRRRSGRRMQVTVRTAAGDRRAELYTVADDGRWHPPSERYLAHILRGLEDAGYEAPALERVRATAARAERRAAFSGKAERADDGPGEETWNG